MVEQKERTRITQSGKNCAINCAIQGVRMIWKQNIWLAICEFLWSLTNQNAWFVSSFCTEFETLFYTVKKINCTALNQSEWRNFFMYIISMLIVWSWVKFSETRNAKILYLLMLSVDHKFNFESVFWEREARILHFPAGWCQESWAAKRRWVSSRDDIWCRSVLISMNQHITTFCERKFKTTGKWNYLDLSSMVSTMDSSWNLFAS